MPSTFSAASAPQRPPAHRSPVLLLGVLVGGAVGTGLRLAAGLALPPQEGAWPAGTLLVNVVGAFLLGLLLETLARRGPDVGARRATRVVVGSGLLGGLTTTSALALETVELAGASPATALAYAGTTLVAGVAAAAVGVALASSVGRGAPGPQVAR
ncbi:fluoride efflux transporter FluC [Pseudokineococcus sp. 1T1Z-3]|uniref:fluoride efflux transporter FluC n=1 Tax=Pseudokineococcus sp. 1T1Z-3 TaxID=3132745 RepID=UPI0030B08D81